MLLSHGSSAVWVVLSGWWFNLGAVDEGGFVWWFAHRSVFPSTNYQISVGGAIQEWRVEALVVNQDHKTLKDWLFIGAPGADYVFVRPLWHCLGEARAGGVDDVDDFFASSRLRC